MFTKIAMIHSAPERFASCSRRHPSARLGTRTASPQRIETTTAIQYNPLNEPTDETHVALLAFYERIEKAIRAIDQNHLLFLE